MARRGETGLDAKLCAKFFEFGIVELLAVVGDNGLRDPETAHNGLPNELGGTLLGNLGKRLCFHPFGEVIDGEHSKLYLNSASRQRADKIDSPLSERVGAAEPDQFCWRGMWDVGEALAFVIFEYKVGGVCWSVGQK